jgi:hypothetical protein
MRFIWLAASAVFAIGAVFAVLHGLRSRPLAILAEIVDSSRLLPDASPALQKRIELEIERSDGCDRTLVRSRVTAYLFLLRRSIADMSAIDERSARFVNAERAVDHALACRPLDGTMWFMAAKLNWIAAFEPDRFRNLVHRSIALAPYEGEAVHARWRFMAGHLRQTNMADDSLLIKDLQTELLYDDIQEANWVAQALKRNGETALVKRVVAMLPEARQKALAYAADPTKPLPDLLSKYHRFKIAPFGEGDPSAKSE